MNEKASGAQRVGRHVRAALAEHGTSQIDIAAVLGMTHAAVGRRVHGHVSFRADELIQIAEHLGVEPARFFRPVSQPRASHVCEVGKDQAVATSADTGAAERRPALGGPAPAAQSAAAVAAARARQRVRIHQLLGGLGEAAETARPAVRPALRADMTGPPVMTLHVWLYQPLTSRAGGRITLL